MPKKATPTPSMPAPPAPADPMRRIADEVRAHAARDALGALALDVLSRQAEGRVLFAGREFVEKRAAEHGVERDQAQTGAGNLLGVLERGPESDVERATVTAFAVHGLGERLARASADDGSALVARFVRHADWLELATSYSVLPFVDAVLPSERAARVWAEVAQAVVDDASGPSGSSASMRARNAARLTALAASTADAAREGLAAVASTSGIDGATRALATTLHGGPVASGDARIRGRVVQPRRSGALAVLRWVSGWALASWAVRGVGSLLGFRREAELALGARGIELREERFVLGRKVGETRSTVAPQSILEAGREVRYPSLHLLVGAIALSFGLLFGGLVLFDGARSGELTLMLAGAALALAGAGLDLALEVLVPGRRGRVTVDVAVHRGRVLRLGRVPLEEADRFLGALRDRRA
ncbi:hypothetical protein [Sandaracinus amylolyticus]|uniref:hypothetical protein n=1 Tax=Sandaracinus amylolyticus TaxID=927083 RepID=UPI001F19C628|nr:hypothetical protein [Sandaracinus amylolyticus]UJR79589.1 Hypothetical protein I5071_16250 [Sandaracinus amylolyticus]